MATLNVSVKYRPIKIGFLVREGSTEDLIKAAGINALLWGGIYNPVIPVSANQAITERLLELFSVDVLFALAHSPETDKVIADHPFLREPHHYGENIFYEDWHTKKKLVAYLDSISIVDFYWEKEFRHAAKDFQSNCALVRWNADDPLANLFAVQFGFYPDEYDLLDDFEKAFRTGLKAKELTVPSGGQLPGMVAGHLTPISLTGIDLTGYGGGWPSEDGIYVGDENDFVDLSSFWNLRAAGIRLRFLSRNHVQRLKEFINAYLKNLDRRKPTPANPWDCIAIYSTEKLQPEIPKILEAFESKKGRLLCSVERIISGDLSLKPRSFYFGWETALATVEESFGRPVVTMGLPDKKFLDGPRGREERNLAFQSLAVSLNFYTESDYPEHTLKPPFLRDLNEFYSREIAFDPWMVRVETGGLALIITASDSSIHLFPLSHQKLIERILALAGITARRSQPGLLAYQIVKNMREFGPLEACRVFKVRGARNLINALKPGDFIDWNAALRIIGSAHFDKFKSLYIESRKKHELGPADVLAFLLKKRILRPRLRLWERLTRQHKAFKCKQCGLESTIPMTAFEGSWSCPFCEHSQYLPEFIGSECRRRDMWKFTKSGLFSKDNNQEGAIPVILSLLTLLRVLHSGQFLYSTSLNLHFEKSCETDLCILRYHNAREIEIGIGECKSEKGRITSQDVSNLKAAREKLKAIGLRCYLVFTKTADSFYDEEITLFRGLKADHVPFVLFTNREIEPYHPYWEKESENLPVRYPHTLAELARNSEFIYLPSVVPALEDSK
jgi:hypothetical protein